MEVNITIQNPNNYEKQTGGVLPVFTLIIWANIFSSHTMFRKTKIFGRGICLTY